MKKTVKIIAVALAAGMLGGLAACSSSGSQITLDSYWYRDNYEGIQNSTLTGSPEVLYYEITFDGDGNGIYRVEYDEGGYYQTTLTATTFDWSTDTIEEYRSDEADTETVYELSTIMEVSGRYIYGDSETEATDDNSVEFSDYVVTVTYFRSARNTLSPLYSRQSVHSASPNSLSPTSAADMCETVQYEYEVFYNRDASEATFTYTEYDPETSSPVTIDNTADISDIFEALEDAAGDVVDDACFEKTATDLDGDYTMLDNNTLYMAMRGMSLSSSFSAVVDLFIPAQGGAFEVSITGGDGGELTEEDNSAIYNAMTAAYGDPPEDEEDDDEDAEEEESTGPAISYNTVSVTANSDISGTAQTAWYATVEDEDNNQYRATMLYLEVPLSYSLGTMQYTLTEVKSVLGSGANTSSDNA